MADMAETLFETEKVVEFDDDGDPVRLTRMVFTDAELADIRNVLAAGAEYFYISGAPSEWSDAAKGLAQHFFVSQSGAREASHDEA